MIIILLPVFLFISFFLLFTLSRNDFVLIRKNITLVEIFDMTILSIFFSYIFGRLFYLLDYKEFTILQPLLFFHIIAVPGISIIGVITGLAVALYLFFRKKKAMLRIYDIVSIAFIPIYFFGIIARYYPGEIWPYPFISSILLLIVTFFLIFWHKNYFLKDGSVAILLALFIAFDTLLIQNIGTEKIIASRLSFTQIFALIFIFLSPFLFLLNQGIIHVKKIGRK